MSRLGSGRVWGRPVSRLGPGRVRAGCHGSVPVGSGPGVTESVPVGLGRVSRLGSGRVGCHSSVPVGLGPGVTSSVPVGLGPGVTAQFRPGWAGCHSSIPVGLGPGVTAQFRSGPRDPQATFSYYK